MNEEFLQFIWLHRKLPLEMYSTTGLPIKILQQGELNTNEGPDFIGAKIQIGDKIWAGNVEIHVNSSDWEKHKHIDNSKYSNIILHVVYQNDEKSCKNHPNVPILEIEPYIDETLLNRYLELKSAITWIPCENHLKNIKQIYLKNWLTRVAVERIQDKSEKINDLIKNYSWEQSFFIWLAYYMGYNLNNEAMKTLAQSIDVKTLLKHKNNLFQIEALLFGQAGFLNKQFVDEYPSKLKTEYEYLKHKYKLTSINETLWKFMRTRPNNFPTIRIAQLGKIIQNFENLTSVVFNKPNYKRMIELLSVEVSDYWKNHYIFDKATKKISRKLSKEGINLLIINAIVPFMFFYGSLQNNSELKEAAIDILENIKAENNNIIRRWENLNIVAQNAAESQALIHLYKNYCTRKQCLKCSIGTSILLDI